MKASDIMEAIDRHLLPSDTLKETVRKMAAARRSGDTSGVKGLHVLDDEGGLTGAIDMMDILRAVHPDYMEMGEDLSAFTWDGMLETLVRRIADKPVADLMRKTTVSVAEDAPLMKCLDVMIKHNLQRLPVINADKKVVGVMYLRDIYNAVVKTLLEDEKEGA
jgi:CBS domain-containing protein